MKRIEDGVEEFTYFNEQDELVFEFIANSAAIAIQNARLLESRRLADRLLSKPDANAVLGELIEFLQGHDELISTLDNAARIVSGKSQDKAAIVDNFVSLSFSILVFDRSFSKVWRIRWQDTSKAG